MPGDAAAKSVAPAHVASGVPEQQRSERAARAACLTFQGVGLSVGDTRIIDDLSLSIAHGGPTLIMGPNGSGKTTLLKLAMGLVAPTDGRVAAAPELRRSLVFSRPVMLRRSAVANIAFARAAADLPDDPAAVARLLELVGLTHLKNRPARKLSSGEQQRLAMARALAREPDILFLDEPTASLDPAATKLIEEVIARVAGGGVKVVMATHDLGQARRLADDVVFLARGRLVEHTPGPAFFREPSTDAARRFLAGELLL